MSLELESTRAVVNYDCLTSYIGRLLTVIGRRSRCNDGLGVTKFIVGGIRPFLRTMTDLMSAAMPLADSKWPMFDFIDPTHKLRCRSPFSQKTWCSEDISAASPLVLPVSLTSICKKLGLNNTGLSSLLVGCVSLRINRAIKMHAYSPMSFNIYCLLGIQLRSGVH